MTDTSNQAVANNTSAAGVGANRLNNIQKIQLRKQQVREWPHPKKLEKLAVYSSCKVCF
jgi:histone acetyltransferase